MPRSVYDSRSRKRFIEHKYEYKGNPFSPLGYLVEKLRKFRKCNEIINTEYLISLWAAIAQAVWRLATGWTVRGSNPDGDVIFRTCPDRPWGPPSLLYNGYQVFPGVKERSGREADPSPLSSVVVVNG